MLPAGREIEVKIAFESVDEARERIFAAGGVVRAPRAFEDNVLLDDSGRGLAGSGRALRLRRVAGTALLTLKAPVAGDHRHKVRVEHESEVADADAVLRLFEALGYRPAYRYQKYRTTFGLEDEPAIVLCLDETPLGCFVEIEGPAQAIDRVAVRLGHQVADYVCESYVELHARRTSAEGLPTGDLVFDAGKAD